MSTFEVKVRRINVEPHNNADLLEIGRVDGYQFIVPKGAFQTGDLGVYIPEQAIVPDSIIAEMELEGKLAGPNKNRVKAIKLRGVLSQGLFYVPPELPLVEGAEVGETLGIFKWEPPIPVELRGEAEPAPGGTIFQTYTDIEDIKKYPGVLQEGEQVYMTEKLHGTCVIAGILNGQRVVSSKGLAGKNLMITESATNTYWRIANDFGLFGKLEAMMEKFHLKQVLLFGEGLGVQDLMYGLQKGQLGFRAFDLFVEDEYLNYHDFYLVCDEFNIPAVPLLYDGPFNQEMLDFHTTGTSTIATHVREGVVVRPIWEREHPEIGRVVLKSISGQYLTRKGDTTEFN